MKPKLLLALHFHQPIGNFDSVFENAVRLCYEPIVTHFERHATVPAAFHFSGCLLEWLEKNNLKFLDRIYGLVARGQIEPMGGGFYEPILTVIPKEDALDQIRRLSEFWEKRTGVRPKGAWLPERVWEPSLAELLYDGEVKYTILDDHHLRLAGLLDPHFSGLYATERNGKSIGFFPSDFQLRYLIPFRTIQAIREHFEKFESDSKEWVLTYGDDAEKFGFWPGTHKWVFEEGWLEQFLSFLEDPTSPVMAVAPGKYFSECVATRKVYIPNASYTEMLEWALPSSSVTNYVRTRDAALRGASPEDVHSFVRGSLWDMFFCKYPEADQMHKHALLSSKSARALSDGYSRKADAISAALRGQCNCAYWHGLFGGIYLPHLRHGIYSSLLEADALVAQQDTNRPRAERLDFDGDLKDEVILFGKTMQAYFRPQDGGTLSELDYLPSRFNVTNVVSRWKESYHEGKDLTHEHSAESGVASPHERNVGIDRKELRDAHFDLLPLRSLMDFVSTASPTAASLHHFDGMTLQSSAAKTWKMSERGWEGLYELSGVSYQKNIQLDVDDQLRINWKKSGTSEGKKYFGTIFHLSLLTPKADDRKMKLTSGTQTQSYSPGDSALGDRVSKFEFVDEAFGFVCELSSEFPFGIATFPIHTLQRSEENYEKVYQGTAIALSWPIELKEIMLKVSFRAHV